MVGVLSVVFVLGHRSHTSMTTFVRDDRFSCYKQTQSQLSVVGGSDNSINVSMTAGLVVEGCRGPPLPPRALVTGCPCIKLVVHACRQVFKECSYP